MYQWKKGVRGYYDAGQDDIDPEKIEEKAKERLTNASKGEAWTGRCGCLHIPILIEKEVVGELWQDEDLKRLEIGDYWSGHWGIKVQLVKDKEIVGFIWL